MLVGPGPDEASGANIFDRVLECFEQLIYVVSWSGAPKILKGDEHPTEVFANILERFAKFFGGFL